MMRLCNDNLHNFIWLFKDYLNSYFFYKNYGKKTSFFLKNLLKNQGLMLLLEESWAVTSMEPADSFGKVIWTEKKRGETYAYIGCDDRYRSEKKSESGLCVCL